MSSNKERDLTEQSLESNNDEENSDSSRTVTTTTQSASTITDFFDGLISPHPSYSASLLEYPVFPQISDSNADFETFLLSEDFDGFISDAQNPSLSAIPDFTEPNANTIINNLFTPDEISLTTEEHRPVNSTLAANGNIMGPAIDFLGLQDDSWDAIGNYFNLPNSALSASSSTLVTGNDSINLPSLQNGTVDHVNPLLVPTTFSYVSNTSRLTEDTAQSLWDQNFGQSLLNEFTDGLFDPLTLASGQLPNNTNTIEQVAVNAIFDDPSFESIFFNQSTGRNTSSSNAVFGSQHLIPTQQIGQLVDPTLSQEVPLRDLLLELFNPSTLFHDNGGQEGLQDQIPFSNLINSRIIKKRKSDDEISDRGKNKIRKHRHPNTETLGAPTTTPAQETGSYSQLHQEAEINEQQQQWSVQNQLIQNQIYHLLQPLTLPPTSHISLPPSTLSLTPNPQNNIRDIMDMRHRGSSEDDRGPSTENKEEQQQTQRKAQRDERHSRRGVEEQNSSRHRDSQGILSQRNRPHRRNSEYTDNATEDNESRIKREKVKKEKKTTDSAHYRPRNAFFMFRGFVSRLQSFARNSRKRSYNPSIAENLLSTYESYQNPPNTNTSSQSSKGLPQTKVSVCCGKLWASPCHNNCVGLGCSNCLMRSLFEQASNYLKLRQAEIERNIQFPLDNEIDRSLIRKRRRHRTAEEGNSGVNEGEKPRRSKHSAEFSSGTLQLSLKRAFNWAKFEELYYDSDLFKWHRESCTGPNASLDLRGIRRIWLESEREYEKAFIDAARKRIEQERASREIKKEREEDSKDPK